MPRTKQPMGLEGLNTGHHIQSKTGAICRVRRLGTPTDEIKVAKLKEGDRFRWEGTWRSVTEIQPGSKKGFRLVFFTNGRAGKGQAGNIQLAAKETVKRLNPESRFRLTHLMNIGGYVWEILGDRQWSLDELEAAEVRFHQLRTREVA